MQKEHQFGWGNTPGIREALLRVNPFLSISPSQIANLDYAPIEGYPELTILVRKLLRKLTGNNYEYITITQGCTHALNAYVHAEKNNNEVLATRKLYFPWYPGVAANHGLTHKPGQLGDIRNAVQILDSPSNPEGEVGSIPPYGRVVWDAAYYSPTYGVNIGLTGDLNTHIPIHEAMAGSLGKFSGINGIKLGWLATNNFELYCKVSNYVSRDLCGTSGLSQLLACEILEKTDLDEFWKVSRLVLDSNRTELQKLAYLFGDQKIPDKGMFALFEVDKKLRMVLDKACVVTTPGTLCGDDRNSVRINLANTNKATKSMVRAVLKVDRKK
jgi:aspartate/methionine/tyrosine aminotransferase